MKATRLASAVATALLLPLAWGTATAAGAATASAPVAASGGGGDGAASMSSLEGELSPAAAELLASGRSRTPPIAESRGKDAEYRRVGAAAPVPPAGHLPPSLAAEVKAKADARSAAGDNGGASVSSLEGELSPAAAELLASGRSRTPPIAESRGKDAEYRRVGAAAPVPPAGHLPPSVAVEVKAKADARSAAGDNGGANVSSLEGELSPAAAELLASGRSRTPPIAESRGKDAEYRRVGAAAPVPPAGHLPPSVAVEVKAKADSRPVDGRGRAAKAKRAKGGAAAKKAARKAGLPRGVDRDAVSREVAAKAAALPIDADVEATMHEVRSAMDRIAPGAKVGAAAAASKSAATSGAVKAAAKAAATAAAGDDRVVLRERLAALELAVLKVNKERDELRLLQSYAAEENRQLTIKLHEVQLALQSASRASGAANPALSRWLSAKELDLSAFVAGTAYEYYTRHSYGPLTAALISYGVLLGPLAASALFFLRHAKALTPSGSGADLLTGVQAMSVFDAAFAAGLVAAIFVARLGDPLLALRDIAPPLFVFLFLAVAAQTVATVAAVGVYFRRAGGVRGHTRVAWALAIKLVVAADFFGRIGVPAVAGRPYIAPVPIGVYLAYVAASSVSLGLVHRARRMLVRAEAP